MRTGLWALGVAEGRLAGVGWAEPGAPPGVGARGLARGGEDAPEPGLGAPL